MKAIGYFVDQGGSPDSAGLPAHEEAFSTFCQRHGHQPLATFVEHDPNGGGRPRYQDLLAYLRQSGSGCLVVIGEPQDLGDTLESSVRRLLELDALGARVLCFDEDVPDPLQQALKHWGGSGRGGLKGERIKEAMRAKAIRGKGLGKPPYGYRIGSEGKLEEVNEESATVRLIFSLYTQEDMGMRRVVRHLNERGAPTRRGGGWSIVTVRDVLRNRAYLGTYTRFGMRVPGSHEALITAQDFNLVQQKMTRMKTPRVAHPGEPFLLSGLVFCSFCGNKMIGVSRRQGWRRKDGSSNIGHYRYYQCQSRTNQGMCGYHTWRSQALERIVLGQAREALEKGTPLSLPESGSQRQLDAAKSLKRLEAQFLKTLERAAAGIVSLERLRSAQEEVDAQREVLTGEHPSQSSLADALARGDVSSVLREWDELDTDTLGQIVRALVSRVSVEDDAVQVILS